MAKKPPAQRGSKAQAIDELMDRASQALNETNYFDAERDALEALRLARNINDFERMSRICLPLLEARRQKRLAAVDSGNLVVLDHESELKELTPGCYLLEPMLVAADGRELRDRADEQRIPVLVLVREPKTQLGLWPLAMIGPTTVRTRVKPPANEKPTIEWMQSAAEALGDEAINTLDLNRPGAHIVDQILDRLGTCPEHEKLHQRLAEYCKQAATEAAEDPKSSKPTSRDEDDDEAEDADD